LKLVKKVLLYFLLLTAVLFISLLASVFLFQEQIIKQFIAEANERLSTPIKIKSIEVSALEHFPNLSIVFSDVYVEDSHAGQYPLLTAKQISFQLNPLEVYRGVYTIRGLEVLEGEATLKINKEGKSNFNIVNEGSTQSESIGFELKNVKFKNVQVHYVDYTINHDLRFETSQLTTFIKNKNNVYAIALEGEVT
jgi:hypothetical protein